MSFPALPIRLRLALWFSLALCVSIVAVGIVLLSLFDYELLREVDDDLVARASTVERAIRDDPGARLDPHNVRAELLALTPSEEFSTPGIYVEIVDHEGSVLAVSATLGSGQLPVTTELLRAALAGQTTYATVQAGAERVRLFFRPLEGQGAIAGAIVVGESLHLLDGTQRAMRQLVVLVAVLAALGCLLAAWWLTGRALRPLTEVAQVARRIRSTGRIDQRVAEPTAKDELHELAATLNQMLASLERSFSRQREFVADASHELRGPLAVIRGNLQLLTMNPEPDEQQEAIRDASQEIQRIARLIEDLLFLAEVDSTEAVLRAPVALDQIVATTVERAKKVDRGTHLLEATAIGPATVLGDRERLEQLAWNLVENALKYSPPGSRIVLELLLLSDRVMLTVSDSGPGIPAEHLPRLFDRFYRVDRARSRDQGSTGLGLAIVKQIAEIHGGAVRVESVWGQGTTFRVELPTYVADRPAPGL